MVPWHPQEDVGTTCFCHQAYKGGWLVQEAQCQVRVRKMPQNTILQNENGCWGVFKFRGCTLMNNLTKRRENLSMYEF